MWHGRDGVGWSRPVAELAQTHRADDRDHLTGSSWLGTAMKQAEVRTDLALP
jgi:hypothetical protein